MVALKAVSEQPMQPMTHKERRELIERPIGRVITHGKRGWGGASFGAYDVYLRQISRANFAIPDKDQRDFDYND